MDETPPPPLRYEISPGFQRILDVTRCSLAISVYLQNRLLLLSADSGKPFLNAFAMERPMGIASATVDGTLNLAVAGFHDVTLFADAPLLAPSVPGSAETFEHLLVPRALLYCGDIDAHDLVWIKNRLFAANTRFSCVCEVDASCSFRPVWSPSFITALMPEDRCHLNGLAVDNERVAYVTALGRSDTAHGWSEARVTGGILLDASNGDAVLEGLCVPHSPRMYDGELFVLESGKGHVLKVDIPGRRAEVLAGLPGFARGMDRLGDILFVGLSRIRPEARVKLPIQDMHESLMCGVAAVERRSGTLLGWVRFDDAFEEIFDVKVLPNFARAGMLGPNDDGHRHALVLPSRAFWAEKKSTTDKKSAR